MAASRQDVADALAKRNLQRMQQKAGRDEYIPEDVRRRAAAADDPPDGEDDEEVRRLKAADDRELPDDDDDSPDDELVEDPATLKAQIAQLQEQLQAANGRVGPTQRDLDTYRQLTAELQRNLDTRERDFNDRITKLQEELEKRAAKFDPAEILDPEELENLDPGVLNSMVKLADAMAQRRVPKVNVEAEVQRLLAERTSKELQDYREQALLSPGLSDIVALKNDPRFLEWAEQDDNEIESTVTMLLNATSKVAVDKYVRILKGKINRYKESGKQSPTPKQSASDAKTNLAAGMRRKQNGNPNPAEIEAQLAQARRLARSHSVADRQKASDILKALGG